eukprot:1495026-Rhodomonas_salina.7
MGVSSTGNLIRQLRGDSFRSLSRRVQARSAQETVSSSSSSSSQQRVVRFTLCPIWRWLQLVTVCHSTAAPWKSVIPIMVRLINTGVPCTVSSKASAGRNGSELKAAVRRLTNNDKSITDLTLGWTLIADHGCQQVLWKAFQ